MRGRELEDVSTVLRRMEHIEAGLFELRLQSEQERKYREARIANRHFWIAIVIPAVIGIITAGSSAVVTILFKK